MLQLTGKKPKQTQQIEAQDNSWKITVLADNTRLALSVSRSYILGLGSSLGAAFF
jgi:hypothetical protein